MPKERRVPINITMPISMLDEIDRQAAAIDAKRSHLMVDIIQDWLDRRANEALKAVSA